MSRIMTLLRRLRATERAAEMEREIDDELRFHLEMRAQNNLDAGMTPDEAKVDALRRFGDYERIKHRCREISRKKLADTIPMKALKVFIWLLLGSGLTLRATSEIEGFQHTGDVLIAIAVLWRLLIYARAMRPVPYRLSAGGGSLLVLEGQMRAENGQAPGLLTPSRPHRIPTYDQQGRTPVERMLADDE